MPPSEFFHSAAEEAVGVPSSGSMSSVSSAEYPPAVRPFLPDKHGRGAPLPRTSSLASSSSAASVEEPPAAVASDGRPPAGPLITLHVYDLVDADHPGAVSTLNTALWLTGIGLYHTGVVIDDVEYTYAGHWDAGVTGVVEGVPRAAPGAVFRTAIPYGRVTGGADGVDVDDVLDAVTDAYGGMGYNLLTRNCNVFCDDLLRRLIGRGAPAWVNRLACLAVRVRCLLPNGFDDPLGGPGARTGAGEGGGAGADGAPPAADGGGGDGDGDGDGPRSRSASVAASDGGGVGAFRGDAGQAVDLDEARGRGSISDVAPLVAFVERRGGAGRAVMPAAPAAAAVQ
ncbi:hypothetical protein BU14_0127s0053 [Porphyra umbilicalis]|uniref:PPPDE domain-containing protein n=1 Tax=Porphyra umbilicalis TaxID=2786 RepID=A0A1X6PB37_PORUM|nr:hypothetical protein BU14_0127s0053 [Porphyra umbilicalis]|eukprot:OSX77956.1 hypothetical protein BU14_0127s0053 [Porphyra umbilicalis]